MAEWTELNMPRIPAPRNWGTFDIEPFAEYRSGGRRNTPTYPNS